VVIAAREQQSFLLRVPIKTVALFSMTSEANLRLNFVCRWLSAMFEIIKDMDFSGGCFCGNYFVRLGHVSGAVYLSRVINLKLNLNAFIFWLA